MSKLSGKEAIVTGASKGIGAAVASRGSQRRERRRQSRFQQGKGGQGRRSDQSCRRARCRLQGDVSNTADARAAVDAAIKTYGRLDVLVNNAGVYEMKPLEEITEEHYHKIFDINVLGLLLMSKEAAKHLTKGGSIVNIGSGVSRITPPNSALPTATRVVVDAITRWFAFRAQGDPGQFR